MLTRTLQSLEISVSDMLVDREDQLRHSIDTRQNMIQLNFQVAGLRIAHLAVSTAVSVAEILTPRSTK